MAVVPETMSRILAYWKHYSEYGNTFAFKPRFVLQNGKLRLLSNPISTIEKFQNLDNLLPEIQKHDWFYTRKFKRDLIQFPYILSVMKNPVRTFGLIARAACDRLGFTKNAAFVSVMRRNMSLNRSFYKNDDAISLFLAIACRFSTFCHEQGATPVFVFLPQRMDLEFMQSGDHYYAKLAEQLSNHMTVIDAGPSLLKAMNDTALFFDDRYGGHYSPAGNKIVAEILEPVVKKLTTSCSSSDSHSK